MGGGPAKEHLLIALPLPEPTSLLASLRAQHPHLEIAYHQSTRDPSNPPPPTLFAKTTILVTFATLPPNPSTDAPNLTWLHLFSAGSNHIQSHPLYTSTDITITTSSGVHGPTIAEWAVLTRLVESRKYNHLLAQQRSHAWQTHDPALANVRDQVGATLGVLGYGSIGRQVARVASALGMRVLAYTASAKDSPASRRDGGFVVPGTGDVEGVVPEGWFSGLGREDLHSFLGRGIDWLVVCVPLTEATRGFLGEEEFRVLREGLVERERERERAGFGFGVQVEEGSSTTRKPFVTNIARGPIIDQRALIAALKDGTLQGAALDVTDPEPLPADSELWDLENVVVTPHISGNGVAYEDRAFQVLGVNLERREKGERLINVVKRERGY